MRSLFVILLLAGCLAVQAQNSSPAAPSKSQAPDSASTSKPAQTPNLAPPRSDHVDASSLGDEPGDSSSKDTQIDLSPPPDDVKAHPNSSDALVDEGTGDASEIHPWDPHKAAKDIEVGDFYFKKKNYRAAEDRYREALLYKENDAMATYRLAVCLEKMDRPDEARAEYESYLKILPYGPLAPDAKKALERLKSPAANARPAR
ncbi:MAG TPA: tetratricopeptide repeat protein [Candidatus Dormibacteraeota bacterium]|nr:tetratricopeptide repeat protein [Candidatus Dormibacteraeota bacterium]